MIGTSAAYVTALLANVAPGAGASARLAWASGVVAVAVYVIGVGAGFSLKEPPRELPD